MSRRFRRDKKLKDLKLGRIEATMAEPE